MSHLQQLFPVTLPAAWQAQAPIGLSETIVDWLYDPNSLTARLKQHCAEFEVKVLGQQIEACTEDEATKEIKAGEQVLVREVLLYCDGKPQVFARSLLPLASLTGEQQELARLGNQPLGQVLFNHPDLIRHSQQVAAFNSTSSVGKLSMALNLTLTASENIWGRRSMFMVADKPILVAEVFLPGAYPYQQATSAVTANTEQEACHD